MVFFIPAMLPGLAKTTAEVSIWLILEYLCLGSLGTIGLCFWISFFMYPRSEAVPTQAVTLNTDDSIDRLSEILNKAQEYIRSIQTDDEKTLELCQVIRGHLQSIETHMERIHQGHEAFKKNTKENDRVLFEVMEKVKSLEQLLQTVDVKALEKIKTLEEELKIANARTSPF